MSDINSFLSLLDSSRRIVVLTGAGVSTLSGIPDFRSEEGLYSTKVGSMRTEDIIEISFFLSHPEVFYTWAKDIWYNIDKYEPNIIHKALSLMEEKGKLSEGIFTQNIDFLHQRAGSKKVYELHGSLKNSYCVSCRKYFTYEETKEKVSSGEVPICPVCGGVIKPDIVFYGEGLDVNILTRGENAFKNADLVLVLGSSLVVNPAASLPYISLKNRKKIVICNRQRTYLDDSAAFVFRDLEELFTPLYEHFK